MTRAYRDPTADQAVSHADKWERMQQALEAKHGVYRGDKLVILDKRTSEGGDPDGDQSHCYGALPALHPSPHRVWL